MLIFLLFVEIISSVTIEGKRAIWHNVELNWKVEVCNMVNYMTMILLVDGSAFGI